MIADRADCYTMDPSASSRGEPIVFCASPFAAPEDLSHTSSNAESVCAMKLLVKFNVILGLPLITCLAVTAYMAYHDLYYQRPAAGERAGQIDDGRRRCDPQVHQ